MMKFDNVPFRRELSSEDLERMRVPRRYWNSTFDMLTEEGGELSLKNMIGQYMKNMSDMKREGAGFILYGKNGVGKSAGSVVLAKEFRRRGSTVLFVEASDLKRLVIEREHFDEDETYWDRACKVDVLIIDDFGKGTLDSKGFGATLFDELIRARNARRRVTIITANLPPKDWKKELELKKSTMEALRECVMPILVTGINHRKDSRNKLKKMLAAN